MAESSQKDVTVVSDDIEFHGKVKASDVVHVFGTT